MGRHPCFEQCFMNSVIKVFTYILGNKSVFGRRNNFHQCPSIIKIFPAAREPQFVRGNDAGQNDDRNQDQPIRHKDASNQ
jgi:hypothetical protein